MAAGERRRCARIVGRRATATAVLVLVSQLTVREVLVVVRNCRPFALLQRMGVGAGAAAATAGAEERRRRGRTGRAAGRAVGAGAIRRGGRRLVSGFRAARFVATAIFVCNATTTTQQRQQREKRGGVRKLIETKRREETQKNIHNERKPLN